MWTSLKKILPAKIRGLGLAKEIEFFNLRKNWDKILGEALGQQFQGKSQPLKIKNGVLLVDCLNSIWANELQMKEDLILAKVKSQPAKPVGLEKIRFISWKKEIKKPLCKPRSGFLINQLTSEHHRYLVFLSV